MPPSRQRHLACLLTLVSVLACSGESKNTSADQGGAGGVAGAGVMAGAGGAAGATGGVAGSAGATTSDACNGHQELCDRSYSDVAFAATHNSNASTDLGYQPANANQNRRLELQLADGVRALLMDVYEEDGQTVLCHGYCFLGSQPHLEALGALRSFLEEHPREVLTIIYEDHISAEKLEADFVDAGLVPYVYAHPPGTAWPTLREMIDSGQRLVVTAENSGGPPAWLHHVWDVAWDTPYSFTSLDELSCRENRGQMGSDLFLMNHWISTSLGLPSEDDAPTANSFDVLHGRAAQCQQEAGQIPNFVAVDFYDHGDLFAVVDALNGVGAAD